MTSPLEQIEVDCGCLAETCDKQGCAVGLEDSPSPFLLIDMDHPDSPAGSGVKRRRARRRRSRQRGTKRCDYLFIGGGDEDTRLYVAPLELKSSGISVTRVSSQLQAGAKIAEHIVPGVSPIRFVPVAAHDGESHRQRINDLAKRENRVSFRGKNYRIRLIRCGEPLSKVFR